MNFTFVLSVLIIYLASSNVNGYWWGGGGGGGGWGGGGYGGYGGYGGWYGGGGGGGYNGNGYSYTIVPEGARVVTSGPVTPGHSVVWSTRNVSPTGYVKCAGRYLRYGEICYRGKIYAEQIETEYAEQPKIPGHTVSHYVV